MVKNEFFLNNSKNIDIWILRKEQNLSRSEFYMWVPNLVKLIEKWPPNIQDGRHEIQFFFYSSTSERGDFPRIIEITLFIYLFL